MAATCVPRRAIVEYVFLNREFRVGLLLGLSCRSGSRHFSFRLQGLASKSSRHIPPAHTLLPPTCQKCQSQSLVSGVSPRQTTRHISSISLWARAHNAFSADGVNTSAARQFRRFSSQRDAAESQVLQGQASEAHGSQVVDPFKLVEAEMSALATDIRQILDTREPLLGSMSHHLFDGKGKSFRPLIALLMSQACNVHRSSSDDAVERSQGMDGDLLISQRIVAMVVEMIHAASLVHDDVIDASETRRGGPSLNKMHGQRLSILTGDYIMSQASIAISRTGNPRVIIILSTIMEDLVSGEFMQLGSKEEEKERFSHYLKKTFRKTASLLANTCQSVAILADCEESVDQAAFEYGRNLGIAFQLVDDMLDFTSTENTMGKPTAADLKLGLATAPVLFAAQEHPELHAMIMRRFSNEGDVDYTRQKVAESDGVAQTLLLARNHSNAAISSLCHFSASPAKEALIAMATMLLNRNK